MLARRVLPVLMATPAMAQPPEGYRWRVTRNGTAIGSHTVTFTERDGERTAVSENLVAPRVMGIVVYRFEHRLTEVTRGGRFISVRSSLNRNGTMIDVTAEASAQGVALRGPEGSARLPALAAPLSWWEPGRFGGGTPLFGTTTGRAMDLRWAREGLPGGATRWRTSGEVEAVLEFSVAGRWSAYQVRGDDGTMVIYEAA